MRRQFMFGTVLAAAMAVGVAAQSGTYGSPSQSDRGSTVTVTGCLQSASAGAATGATGSTAGTTGTTGSTSGTMTGSPSSASSPQFMLTNVSMGASDSSASAATTASGSTASSSQTSATGTSGSASISPQSTLWLAADKDSSSTNAVTTTNWSKYLNHRVEVKGMLQPSSGASAPSSAAGSTASGSTASTEPSSSMSANQSAMGTLHVTSIKDVAGTCSGSQR